MCSAVLIGLAAGQSAWADDTPARTVTTVKTEKAAGGERLLPEEVDSDGAVDAAGQHIAYRAVAGTIVVHPKGWDDAAKPGDPGSGDKGDDNPSAESSMFYVAYFRKGVTPGSRPITFLYNGGPGSPSVWLHMGSFGPRRVELPDHEHGATSPFRLVNNAETLLDVTDLVFVDAPGTGFSRIVGKDKEKAFFGVDQDAHAFSVFIEGFLSRFARWDSPRYLFGESYGTTR
ncbi:MAG: peptidase S10, partial [Gluconacetobacter diazotrophicus]|nr:peptidase S10 [Gluconacetobacter diazotrophicus]